MNLQRIALSTPLFYFFCIACNKESRSDCGHADLDGEPFKAYYCSHCTADLKSTAINRGQQPLDLD